MNNSIAMQGSIRIKPRQRRLKHKDHDFKGQAAFHSETLSKKNVIYFQQFYHQ